MPERHSDADIDRAIEALSDPARLEEAQRLVAAKAPQLQRILDEALSSAGWFGQAHQAEVLKAAGKADPEERVTAVRTLIAEETRVSMLVGVAVGYELAQNSADERRFLMAVDIRFLGQACFELKAGGTTVLTDPFLTGNPLAAASADEVEADAILLTHGHGDHLGDTVDIAKRTGATVVAIVELAAEIGGAGVENVNDPNFGGTVQFDWGWVKLVPAWHTAVSPSGTPHMPAGLLIHIGDRLIYHLGDTCLFSDMQLIARRGDKVDLALVPIGGHYTMDRFDAVTAVEFIQPQQVIPCHYNTFPPIEADAEAFKSDVQNAGFSEVVVLEPGGTHTLK